MYVYIHTSQVIVTIPDQPEISANDHNINNNNNNNNTLFNEDLQIKLQLVQLVSNLVLLSSRNILSGLKHTKA